MNQVAQAHKAGGRQARSPPPLSGGALAAGPRPPQLLRTAWLKGAPGTPLHPRFISTVPISCLGVLLGALYQRQEPRRCSTECKEGRQAVSPGYLEHVCHWGFFFAPL